LNLIFSYYKCIMFDNIGSGRQARIRGICRKSRASHQVRRTAQIGGAGVQRKQITIHYARKRPQCRTTFVDYNNERTKSIQFFSKNKINVIYNKIIILILYRFLKMNPLKRQFVFYNSDCPKTLYMIQMSMLMNITITHTPMIQVNINT
jgi:hypothetical protein